MIAGITEVAVPAQVSSIEEDLDLDLLQQDIWSDEMLERAGIPIVDVPFVTVGAAWHRSAWWRRSVWRGCRRAISRS